MQRQMDGHMDRCEFSRGSNKFQIGKGGIHMSLDIQLDQKETFT